jgi:acetylornithine deacetylase
MKMDKITSKKILNCLDFLIKQDTQNPPRNITQSDKLFIKLNEYFSSYGYLVEVTDLGNGHVIFYAKKGLPNVLFNVHLDTVPVTKTTLDQWHNNPLELTVKEAKAYGRGSCDIKGAAACLMVLAETAVDLAVVFTTDEEGANGCCVQHFIDHNDLSNFQQIIVAEPTQSKAVIAHRGYLSSQVEFKGNCGHSSLASALTSNAIHKSNSWLYQAICYANQFVNPENPAGICFNVGFIKGGEKNNMIAENLNLGFSARVPPGMSSKNIYIQLQSFDNHKDSLWNTSMIAPALPAENMNPNNVVEFCTKHSIEIANSVDFWTEAALFSQAGHDALVLGPGDIKQAHSINEWVEVSQLEQCYDIYAEVTRYEK